MKGQLMIDVWNVFWENSELTLLLAPCRPTTLISGFSSEFEQ
jgi:hypothetical protein